MYIHTQIGMYLVPWIGTTIVPRMTQGKVLLRVPAATVHQHLDEDEVTLIFYILVDDYFVRSIETQYNDLFSLKS